MTAANKSIGVLLEWHGKRLTEAAAEALATANKIAEQLATTVTAFGVATAGIAEAELRQLPVEKLYHCPETAMAADLAAAVARLEEEPGLFFAPMSLQGREFTAFYSLEKNCGLVDGCSGIAIKEDCLQLTRLTTGGLAQQEKNYPLSTLPSLVLGLTPGAWGGNPELNGNAEIIELPIEAQNGVVITKEYLADWQEIGVSEADLVIAGGGGMGGKEGFDVLYQLGQALAAPVGGSRVAEDKGWIRHEAMIGATGQTIAPEAYIACGISGAIQHSIGIQNCKRVIAVNIDPMCALMTNADLAVLADGRQTIEALVKKLKAYRPKKEV